MKTVIYESKTNQWVGTFPCPRCNRVTKAWRSSGMSALYPHFYCNRCSNAYQNEKDKVMLSTGINAEVLKSISESLPECPCGGRFVSGSNPKCPECNFEFKHRHDDLNRLTDPNVILIDGACFFGSREPYKVIIE